MSGRLAFRPEGKPAAFLDRDGTLCIDRGYLGDPARVELLPGVVEGLRRLTAAGYELVVVTNQSGVGRGLLTLQQVEAVNSRLAELLAAEGVAIKLWQICPHGPHAGCGCRKPATGLVAAALERHAIRREGSFVLGDKDTDMLLAEAAGLPGYLLRTGEGAGFTNWAVARGIAVHDTVAGVVASLLQAEAAQA